MGDQFVGLFEGAFVEQELDALARRHLAFLVLPFAALGSAAFLRQRSRFFSSASFCSRFIVGEIGSSELTNLRMYELETENPKTFFTDISIRQFEYSSIRKFPCPPRYSMLEPIGWYRYFLPSQNVADVIRSAPDSSA